MKNVFLIIIVCLGFILSNSCERKEAAKIATTTLFDGVVGEIYHQELTAIGTVPITWILVNGKLPNGLTLSKDGTISGTPTADGAFEFTVQATNKAGNDTKKLSITIITPEEQKIEIKTTTLTNGMVGTAYNQQLTATGATPITWTLLEGDFPNGLTLSTNGTISGKPTADGIFNFTVQATNDAVGSDSKTLSIRVNTVEPFLTVEERFVMLEAINNKGYITIKSNGNWTAIIENAENRNWCTLSKSDGFGNEKITVNVAPNTSDLMRVAVVKIVSGEFTKTVLICQNLKVTQHVIKCDWDYPPDWKEQGGVAACQIPEHILDSLSTACLTKICLQYPLLFNILAYNYMSDGFNNFFNTFNGIRELYKRETALSELLKEYHKHISNMSMLEGWAPNLEKGYFILFSQLLEVLLYGYSQKVEAPIESYEKLLLYLTVGYEKKLKYVNYFQGSGFTSNFFARANIIIKIDATLSEIFDGKSVLFSGIVNADLIDTIDNLSYNLIK